MEKMSVTVLVTRNNEQLKCIQEDCEKNVTSLIGALKKIKGLTNDYLTELVDEEKKSSIDKKSGKQISKADNDDDGLESDVEIEEDFIDAEIKKKLSAELSSESSNIKVNNNKRSKNRNIPNKRKK